MLLEASQALPTILIPVTSCLKFEECWRAAKCSLQPCNMQSLAHG